MIALYGLVAQFISQPHTHKTDNVLCSLVCLLLVMFFVLGLIVKLCDHGLCMEVVGLQSAYTASVLIIGAGFLVLLLPFAMFVFQLYSIRHVPILLLASTMEPPLLPFEEGEHYHLFL